MNTVPSEPTPNHQPEQAIESSPVSLDQRATEILDSITDGFFALDREWRFTYLNRQGLRILARSAGDLVGKVLWEVYPGLEGGDLERVYHRAMHESVASSATEYYAAHDRWYEAHAYPAPDGISIYFRDVSERVRAEAERERLVAQSEIQRRIYEAALSNTPDLVYVFDLDHRFTYANEALLRMWGRTREDALGKTCLELGYEPWHAAMHDREIEQVVATCKPIRGEVPFTGTEGRRMYDYIFVPVIGASGAVVAVAGTTRDVTERQQAEQAHAEQAERLREADRAKDEFLATLAHELRNPLAPIANSIEILKLASDNADVASKARATLERQLKHMVRLVDDLLDVSRITRGRLELRKERVDLGVIVEQAIESCRPHIEAQGHEFEVTVPEVPLRIDADAVRLVQVVSNLLNNAAKYTPRRGSVSLQVNVAAAEAEIRIADSGIGIAPEMLEHVFDMFIRADHSLERTQDGLGVGLTLARRLVELHGGTITARSEGPGRGSEFTVRLPLAAVD
jgi:PAS domain S-box-containing protein